MAVLTSVDDTRTISTRFRVGSIAFGVVVIGRVLEERKYVARSGKKPEYAPL
jgi:hypothetical protein